MKTESAPTVTIGIPTYNRAGGYLRQALQSALSQTCSNIEVIVSDNCSTDDTDKYVEQCNDPRVRYFKHEKNIGANNNFNFCVDQARGEYFLLLHDDDLIDRDFVEICLEAICAYGEVGVVRTGTRIIDSDSRVIKEVPNRVVGRSTEEFFVGWFNQKTALYLCSTLFNTNRLRELGGFSSPKNLFQDVVAEVQLAAKYGRADVLDVKASFRRHAGEMTYSAKVSDWCEDSLVLLDLMCDLATVDNDLIRQEGMKYFAKKNYVRASSIDSFKSRLAAYFSVFELFGCRHLPPLKTLSSRSPMWRSVQRVKNNFKKNRVSEGE